MYEGTSGNRTGSPCLSFSTVRADEEKFFTHDGGFLLYVSSCSTSQAAGAAIVWEYCGSVGSKSKWLSMSARAWHVGGCWL